jgi:hypothetical protein
MDDWWRNYIIIEKTTGFLNYDRIFITFSTYVTTSKIKINSIGNKIAVYLDFIEFIITNSKSFIKIFDFSSSNE